MTSKAQKLLRSFNVTYTDLHRNFEQLFWLFKMGDHSVETDMHKAEKERDAFRSDIKNTEKIKVILSDDSLTAQEKEKLNIWANFFRLYQTPPELAELKDKIAGLESKIAKKKADIREGYTDPKTGEFVAASKGKMGMMMRTNPDEEIRKACFVALGDLSVSALDEYVEVIGMRNEYARVLGFEDYYAYHVNISEGMTKEQIFKIFDEIYDGTKYVFGQIRELEATQPGLRKPWNFSYMMSGQFAAEEDPYYNFDDALIRWGRSFDASGINFKGGQLKLDLLDRKGKYNNGFCHYPEIVNFNDGRRNPGAANFTCNLVYGQVGSGFQGSHTLFHEAAHAADRLNSEQTETCLNTEWPPASIAWAETHSQFFDTMFASIEWRMRYAKDSAGNPYPFELFEQKTRKLRILAPSSLYSIMMVSEFEKRIYETKDLTVEKAINLAKEMTRKYCDYSVDSLWPLSVPHIYDWESSAYYHAYGLAVLALQQWREYFYDKYGYIVDNPKVGEEMTRVWTLGSAMSFNDFVKVATGQELSAKSFLDNATMDIEDFLNRARRRTQTTALAPEQTGPVRLNAHIRMVHNKEVVCDNAKSFEDMAERYKKWLHKQPRHG